MKIIVGKTEVVINQSKTGVIYTVVEELIPHTYYRIKNGDNELITHIDNLKVVREK